MSQDDTPISRLKWGTASLIVRATLTPIVLPIVHHGFQKVTPYIVFSLSIIIGLVSHLRILDFLFQYSLLGKNIELKGKMLSH